MRQLFANRMREHAERRGRLGERLAQGDPDPEPDEIQASDVRAEQKRKELRDRQEIRLIPDQGGLWAECQLQPAALLKGVGMW